MLNNNSARLLTYVIRPLYFNITVIQHSIRLTLSFATPVYGAIAV